MTTNAQLVQSVEASSEVGFSKECPSLSTKRKAAIKYLGSKYIFAAKVEKFTNPLKH